MHACVQIEAEPRIEDSLPLNFDAPPVLSRVHRKDDGKVYEFKPDGGLGETVSGSF